jgi:hypothetical protein
VLFVHSLPPKKNKSKVKTQKSKVKSKKPATATVLPGGFAIRHEGQVKSQNAKVKT